jgi:hypothetical protein
MKQSDAQDSLDVDRYAASDATIGEQHRGHAHAKGMRGHGFSAVGKTTQGPAGAIEALEALKLD